MKVVTIVKIDKQLLLPYLMYSEPIVYSEHITLSPVTMKDILNFQLLSQSLTVRKNSIFREKKIIKMTYFDLLIYCFSNEEIEEKYKIPGLSRFYIFAFQLLMLCCKDAKIKISENNGYFIINDEIVTPEIFDDLRRIIILQNDIDFDIDEFLNYDTEQRLLKAQKDLNKTKDPANIEDYIDSLAIALNTTDEKIKNMTIRKFWRYFKRYRLHEQYTFLKSGECSGFVKFKEPIKDWVISIEVNDRYADLKTDENELKGKIRDAN